VNEKPDGAKPCVLWLKRAYTTPWAWQNENCPNAHFERVGTQTSPLIFLMEVTNMYRVKTFVNEDRVTLETDVNNFIQSLTDGNLVGVSYAMCIKGEGFQNFNFSAIVTYKQA
jgi:hypothetical protein